MAKCKYCHESITRLDKEVCPFCGGLKPLDGTDTSTQDITKVIGQVETKVEIKHKKRLIAALLSFFLGFFGLQFFYVGKKVTGLASIALTLVVIGGFGGGFFAIFGNVLSFIITAAVVEIVNIVFGLDFLLSHNVVDSNGEFLD